MPLFFAYHRDAYLTSGHDVNAVIEFVLDVIDPTADEDAVVWCEGKLVAVVQSGGNVIRFGQSASWRSAGR